MSRLPCLSFAIALFIAGPAYGNVTSWTRIWIFGDGEQIMNFELTHHDNTRLVTRHDHGVRQ